LRACCRASSLATMSTPPTPCSNWRRTRPAQRCARRPASWTSSPAAAGRASAPFVLPPCIERGRPSCPAPTLPPPLLPLRRPLLPSFQVASSLPSRPPDAVVVQATSAEQGAMYRAASGDLHPLHVDPAVAKAGGFPGPLLAGTCTLGMGVRHVFGGVCGGGMWEGFGV